MHAFDKRCITGEQVSEIFFLDFDENGLGVGRNFDFFWGDFTSNLLMKKGFLTIS